jgi:AcrR family transcriptional regulator
LEPVFERTFPGPRKARKREVLSCALACFVEQGLDAVTIEVIRDRSGASIGTIYHHFGNKEGLVAAIYLAGLDDQQAWFEKALRDTQNLQDAIKAWVTAYIEWVVSNPRLARFMYQSRRAVAKGTSRDQLKGRNEQRYSALMKFLEDGVAAGDVRVLPRETYASLLIGQSENYCRAWLSGRVTTPPNEHIHVFSDAAWRSIAADAVQ